MASKQVTMTDLGSYSKRILVTGGAGFIGSHVVNLLVEKYPRYLIVNLDILDYCASLKSLESISKAANYRFVKGSILSEDLVTFVMTTFQIDTVMHFAAQSHVDNSFGNSLTFTKTNVMGTHVLLEAAKLQGVSLFLHVSTDEVYGDGAEGTAHSEAAQLAPTNPYSASKAAAEHVVQAYQTSFGLPTIITRSNNVYGPHQYPEKLIPKLVNQIMRGRPLTLHGDGTNTRNYLHVSDVARAFDVILHQGTAGQVYNISSSVEKSNMQVAGDLLRVTGVLAEDEDDVGSHVTLVEDRPFNDLRYHMDGSKLHALGWRAEVPWEEGLKGTAAWYAEHAQHWGNVEAALVAHPRRGLPPAAMLGLITEVDPSGASGEAAAACAQSQAPPPATVAGGGSQAVSEGGAAPAGQMCPEDTKKPHTNQ